MMSVLVFLAVNQTWCKEAERKSVLVNTAASQRDGGEKLIYKTSNVIR